MIKPVIDIKMISEVYAEFGSETYVENVKIEGIDCTEDVMADLSLGRVFLDGVTLNQVKIDDLKVVNSIFSNCSLAGMAIEQSHFSRLECRGVRLQGIHLAQSRMIDTTFLSSKMNDANLRYSKLKNILFDSCDLSGVDCIGAELTNVVFTNCNLTGVNFSQSKHFQCFAKWVRNNGYNY